MSARFVIGRAGVGKTHHCLKAIRAELSAAAMDGSALIWLVPEQAALQSERSVLSTPHIRAAHRLTVCGFTRLASRILETSGASRVRAVSSHGRVMLLRCVLGQLGDDLRYYRNVRAMRGFMERLADAVSEMISEAIGPEDLAEVATRAECEADRRMRLGDLRLIYAAYLEALGPDRVDPSQFLSLATSQAERCDWLRDGRVWVDGFAGFTRQEMRLLARLASLTASVEVTCLIDPVTARSKAMPSADSAGLFDKTLRTYGWLCEEMTRAGVTIEAPVMIEPETPARFVDRPSLALLERSLSTSEGFDASAVGVGGAGGGDCEVEIVALPDRRSEVDYAVSRVLGWVRDESTGFRYRDIALIVRDLEPYHDLLSAALNDRGVPFFIDRRRPTGHHPLPELMRSLVAMADESMSLASVRAALKTGLLGIEQGQVDALENFLLAHGIAGREVWTGVDWTIVADDDRIAKSGQAVKDPSEAERAALFAINQTRRALMARLEAWLGVTQGAPRLTGLAWARAIASALDALDVAGQLERWAEGAHDSGDLDLAEAHRQMWREAVAFIDDLGDALADQVLDIAALRAVLESGLGQFTLALAPPMLDQVLVGGIERSRHPDLRAVVLLGFHDGAYPRGGSESSIFNDDDREYLAGLGMRLGTPQRRRVLEERLLAYVAMTRASDRVVITHPLADDTGREIRPSPYLADIDRALGGKLLASRGLGPPSGMRALWPVMTAGDLATSLAVEFRSRPRVVDDDDVAMRAAWNELYNAARQDEELRPALERVLPALVFENHAALSAGAQAGLFEGVPRLSVSRLETFAACPFQHFASYTLGLREREVARLEPVDVGRLHHALLEDFVGALVDQRQPLGELSDAAIEERLAASCERVRLRPALGEKLSDARERYQMRRARQQLHPALGAMRDASRLGAFRPRAVEKAFGMGEPGSLPALEIGTPAGRRVLLGGYIDRVDLAEHADELLGIVTDYKHSRDRKLNWSEMYYGISLQLVAYLLVLAERGETLAGRPMRPIGAFYVSLRPGYETLEHPDDYDGDKHGSMRRYRARGVLDFGRFGALESGHAGGSASGYAVRSKDGKIQYASSSDAVMPEQFDSLLEYTRFKLGQLADRVIDGEIEVAPYRLGTRTPCSWCSYRPVCRFDFELGSARWLTGISRNDVLDKIVAEQSKEPPCSS